VSEICQIFRYRCIRLWAPPIVKLTNPLTNDFDDVCQDVIARWLSTLHCFDSLLDAIPPNASNGSYCLPVALNFKRMQVLQGKHPCLYFNSPTSYDSHLYASRIVYLTNTSCKICIMHNVYHTTHLQQLMKWKHEHFFKSFAGVIHQEWQLPCAFYSLQSQVMIRPSLAEVWAKPSLWYEEAECIAVQVNVNMLKDEAWSSWSPKVKKKFFTITIECIPCQSPPVQD